MLLINISDKLQNADPEPISHLFTDDVFNLFMLE